MSNDGPWSMRTVNYAGMSSSSTPNRTALHSTRSNSYVPRPPSSTDSFRSPSKPTTPITRPRLGARLPQAFPSMSRLDSSVKDSSAEIPDQKGHPDRPVRRYKARGLSSVRLRTNSRSGNIETVVARRASSEVAHTSRPIAEHPAVSAHSKIQIHPGMHDTRTPPPNNKNSFLQPLKTFWKSRRKRTGDNERPVAQEGDLGKHDNPLHYFGADNPVRESGFSTKRKLPRAATLKPGRKLAPKEPSTLGTKPENLRVLNKQHSAKFRTRSTSLVSIQDPVQSSKKPVIIEDDPYRVLAVGTKSIGEGSSGSVYPSTTQNGQTVALKVIEHPTDEDYNEVTVMQQVRSSHLMRCYMSFRWEGSLFVAMDLMEIGSVFERLRALAQSKKYLSEPCIAYIIKQLLLGLQALHDQNIVHGDLKPDNLLIAADGSIRVADFGSAVFLENGSRRKCRTGTPHWMAPEVARREPVSEKADLWSVGICAFELAEFNPPLMCIKRDLVMEMLANDLYPQPTMSLRRSFLFQDFLYVCTDPDAQLRPSIAELFNHPFLTQLNGFPNPATLLAELCPGL